jgi:hypothetical protein
MISTDYTQHYTVTDVDKILLYFFLHLATRNLINVSHRARLPRRNQIKEKETHNKIKIFE